MTLARARSLAVLAGLLLWLVAWLGRPAGLAGPAWALIVSAGTIVLLAAAAGRSWPDLIQERICLPLGLTATAIVPDARTARGHDQAGLPVPYWDSAGLPGAGALVSCTADLEAFLRAQLEPDRAGLGEAIRLSRTSHTGGPAARPAGLGWMLETTTQASTLAWHNGGTAGFGSFLAVAGPPGRPAGIALLANSVHSTALDVLGRRALRSLAGSSG